MFSWDANDSVTQLLQVVVALGVVLALVLVNRAVNLDDEVCFKAKIIDDVRADRMLTSEAPTADLAAS